MSVERESEESVWRMHTNCKQVGNRSRKGWLSSGELKDPKCFEKDVAVGMMEHQRER